MKIPHDIFVSSRLDFAQALLNSVITLKLQKQPSRGVLKICNKFTGEH